MFTRLFGRALTACAWLLLSALSFGVARAQAATPVTFGASVTNANGSLSTTLTWNAPGANGCVASGHPTWAGNKAASGTLALPAITMSGTYALKLDCSFPGNKQATLTWKAPTENTDGSALTNLAGFRVVYGTSASALSQTVQVPGAGISTFIVDNLAAGTWFFAVKAYNADGVESAISNVASKAIVAGTSGSASVSLTINPVPAAATNLQAT